MKYYKKENVLMASLERIRYIFDEFPNVVVGFSGGKDSTVTLNLALQVAREKDRLPLSVLWVDQEAEWQYTSDYCKSVFENSDIKPYWYQMPMVITNNASSSERYSSCWDEENPDKWMRPKDEKSIKVNKYNTVRFHELFEAIFKVEFPNQKSCYLAGVRTEETPKRFVALTHAATYNHITYGKVLSKKLQHYTFYPLYDWSYTDVWKYIHDNKIEYNKIYDQMYRYGLPLQEMRVSNLHHETAIQSLLLVHEIEPNTWNRMTDHLSGANTIKHLERESFRCPKVLPYMFKDWEEYAYYLADNMISEQKYYDMLMKKIADRRHYYDTPIGMIDFWKTIIKTILSADWDFTKFKNWEMERNAYNLRKYMMGSYEIDMLKGSKFFTQEQFDDLIIKLKENGSLKDETINN